LVVAALAAWIFGGLTQDVVGHDEMALIDPRVLHWVVDHRTSWLTLVMKTATWLGSSVLIVPLVVLVGAFLLIVRRDWRPAAQLAVAFADAIVLYDITKAAVGRARPPASAWIGHYSGSAFPSGHATQTVAFYGMLALALATGRSARTRLLVWSAVALIRWWLVPRASTWVPTGQATSLGGYALGPCGWRSWSCSSWLVPSQSRIGCRLPCPSPKRPVGEIGLLRHDEKGDDSETSSWRRFGDADWFGPIERAGGPASHVRVPI
jgi:membrane-associated phospholipid phosphatase